MALDREILAIPFVGGLDTKSDAKLMQPTKMTLLENGEFTKYGSIRKRKGYDQTSLVMSPSFVAETGVAASGATPLGTPRGLFTRNDETVLATSQRLYSLDTKNDAWLDRGPFSPTTHRTKEVCYNAAEQTFGDCATNNGITVYAWEDSRTANRIRYTIVDASGAAFCQDKELVAVNSSRPRVIPVGSNILLLYADNANTRVKCKLIRTNDVKTSIDTAPTDVTNDLAASLKFDACSDGTSGYVIWEADGSATLLAGLGILKLNSVGTASLSTQVVTPFTPTCLAIAYEAAGATVGVAYANATDYFLEQAFNASTLAQVASSSSGALANVAKIALCDRGGDDTTFEYWIGVQTGSASNYYVLNSSDGNTYTIRHATIMSKAWYDGEKPHVILGYESRTGVQHSYYVYGMKGFLEGVILPGLAVPTLSKDHLASIQTDGNGAFIGLLGFRRKLQVASVSVGTNAIYAHKGLQHVEFVLDVPVHASQLGDTVYLTGNHVWAYDGQGAVEAGFHMFPDMINGDLAASDANNQNLTTAVQYNYRVYYCWYTETGEKMKSAALTLQLTPTFASGEGKIVLTIPTLQHTVKASTSIPWVRTDVFIEVFRAEGNKSTLFYKVTSDDPAATGDNGWVNNSFAADTVTFTDNMADSASLVPATTLMTKELDSFVGGVGGELQNIVFTPCEYLTTIQDRLWMLGGEYGDDSVGVSKLHLAGSPVHFNDSLVLEVGPDDGGRLVAAGDLNGTPILFKERVIYQVLGTGPDNTGGGDSYVSQLITVDSGCSEPRSVVKVPGSLLYSTEKGIYILDGALNSKYFGLDVEEFNGQTITSARHIPNTNQVIWLSDDGTTLLLDYQFNQWSTFTNHQGMGSVFRADIGKYAYLRNDGVLFTQGSGYTDAGSPVRLRLRTAPIRPQDTIQGFARLRRFDIIGEYQSPHDLRVGLIYDREPYPSEEFTWDPTTVIDTSTWGSFATWDSDPVWGGSGYGGSEYQFQHKPQRQKFQSIRFEFSDVISGEAGASFELSEIAMELGVKPGLARLSATRKI